MNIPVLTLTAIASASAIVIYILTRLSIGSRADKLPGGAIAAALFLGVNDYASASWSPWILIPLLLIIAGLSHFLAVRLWALWIVPPANNKR